MANGRKTGRSSTSLDNAVFSSRSQVAHTLTACCRCRQRKTRCDAGLPRCGPCERHNAYCEYFDAAKGHKMPRSYVVHLQERVRELENQLAAHGSPRESSLNAETLVRGAGLVRLQDNEEPSFLGPSSGINMTRLVLELAKGIRKIKKIKELVPEEQAHRIRARFETEARKPTSKVYPEISSVAAPHLPPKELTDMLVENFFKKGQCLYPVLHEPSFLQDVLEVYNGSSGAYQNFTLRMVIALSMQKLSSQWTGLADGFYLAALPFLENTVRQRNLGTLQAFMLIAQYSMVTPTRTAANWVMVMATRLCQELGITEEATIDKDGSGQVLDALQIDMRRRCYWVCLAMEHGLAHSTGRPNALGTPHTYIDVGWFQLVDDRYITAQGILPGPVSPKKCIAKHFISMRLLQLEIRRTLYLRRQPHPNDDSDPWFLQMENKLEKWLCEIPHGDAGTGFDREWFVARHNTIVVFLCRPSPQIPEPSARAARRAFDASKFNIELQRRQIDEQKVDLTWIFAQSLFMAINTVLWATSYAEIRGRNSRENVTNLLDQALECAYFCSLKWPGVEGAIELYGTLRHSCLKAYDGDVEQSYSLASPINRPSPTTTGSPDLSSSPLSSDFSRKGAPSGPSSPQEFGEDLSYLVNKTRLTQPAIKLDNHQLLTPPREEEPIRTSNVLTGNVLGPAPYNHALPTAFASNADRQAPDSWSSPFMYSDTAALETMPNYLIRGTNLAWHTMQSQPALNLHQQSELMNQLEACRMEGISRAVEWTEY